MSSFAISRGAACTSNLIDKLFSRGLIDKLYPASDEYRDKLNNMLQSPTTIYSGFDATSSSLHVGNLATMMNMFHFLNHGHQVVCVIGDATAQIGDPSGHSKDRKQIEKKTVLDNANSIEYILKRLFRNQNEYFNVGKGRTIEPIIIRNSAWYKDSNVIDFVGEFFREVRIGDLLHKKSISERLKGDGINLSEFCYQVFQAYDWIELRRRYNCKLQLGGSDQGGNIYTGHNLVKKILGHTDSIGLLAPLLTNDSGKKLGKSSESVKTSIWLDPQLTSPYALYQYFQRTPDKYVEKLLKIFSFHDNKTIEDLIYNHLRKPEDVWYCQNKLAEQVCLLVHGLPGLDSAKRLTHAFYNKNPLDIAKLSDDELNQLFDGSSIIKIMYKDGLRVLDLIRRANCVSSDLDAERIVSAGGLRLNGSRVTSINVPITEDLIIGNDITLMRLGKRNYFLFKWNQ